MCDKEPLSNASFEFICMNTKHSSEQIYNHLKYKISCLSCLFSSRGVHAWTNLIFDAPKSVVLYLRTFNTRAQNAAESLYDAHTQMLTSMYVLFDEKYHV